MQQQQYDRFSNGVHTPTARDLVAVLFRHRRVLAVSFLTIFLAVILYAVLQPKRYEAEMKILVKRERADPVVSAENSISSQLEPLVTEEELNSEVELLKSRDLLEKVVIDCDLARPPHSRLGALLGWLRRPNAEPEFNREAAIAAAVQALQARLSAEVVKKTNLIAVNYRSQDPNQAARVLTKLGDLYLEKHLAVHRPPGAFDFFQHASQQYRKGLTEAESRLVDFSQGAAGLSPELEKQLTLQKLADFDASLKQTEVNVAETQRRIGVLQQELAATPARTVTQVRSLDDATLLSQLRSNLLNLELKRTDLLGKFEPGYRLVQDVDRQIAQTREALAKAEQSQLREQTTDRDLTYEWIAGELAKAKADLAGLQAQERGTAQAVQGYQENARYLEQKQMVHDDLVRSVKTAEENYLLYVRKEEEARISDALDRKRIINVAIAEAATVPSFPSNRRSLLVLFGMLLASVTSVGLAFGAEYLDPTFRTPDEVTTFLNIPVLAAVPQNDSGRHSNGHGHSSGANGNGFSASHGNSGVRAYRI